MPIFLLAGNIGDFIGPIAISVVMALLGSLAISLTVIAALAARYLPRDADPKARWYRRGYQLPQVSMAFRTLVGKAIKRPVIVLPVIVAFCLSGFVLSQQLANVFFPSADRDQFEVYVFLPEGSGINHTYENVLKIDEYVRSKNDIGQVTWLVGNSTPAVYYNQVMTRDNSPNFANAVITANSVERRTTYNFCQIKSNIIQRAMPLATMKLSTPWKKRNDTTMNTVSGES